MLKTLRTIVLLSLVLGLTACASRLPEDIRGDGSPTIQYGQAIHETEAHLGSHARWGGVIASVTNQTDSSLLEIVHFSLRGTGRPHITDRSQGRFRIRVAGFVDPEIYAAGRSVTVYGVFTGLEEGKIGEFEYNFPVIASEGIHLWRVEEQPTRVDVLFYSPGHFYYRQPLYRPTRFYRSPHPVGTSPRREPVMQQSPRVQGEQPQQRRTQDN